MTTSAVSVLICQAPFRISNIRSSVLSIPEKAVKMRPHFSEFGWLTTFSPSGRSVLIDITRKTTMSKQEATIQALQTLYARLDALRHMKVSDMLSPGQQTTFEQTIEEAYAALAKIETELDELGETLEYHHARLGGAIE